MTIEFQKKVSNIQTKISNTTNLNKFIEKGQSTNNKTNLNKHKRDINKL